jgi:release factor glutamine methyltransferase
MSLKLDPSISLRGAQEAACRFLEAQFEVSVRVGDIPNATHDLSVARAREVAWILAHALGWSVHQVRAEPRHPLGSHHERFVSMIMRRATGEPVQYILGSAAFRKLTVKVTPAVLIPRPETEELLDHVHEWVRSRAIYSSGVPTAPTGIALDVGTGSGCIALAIRSEIPQFSVVGLDVSEEALAVARQNGRDLGLEVAWQVGDLFSPSLYKTIPVLDVVVSNPPYIPPSEAPDMQREVVRHEPPLALFTGTDPLAPFDRLISLGRRRLRGGGLWLVEGHVDYVEAVAVRCAEAGFEDVTVLRDLYGRPRFVRARQPAYYTPNP